MSSLSLCLLIYKMSIRKTPKQAYCEKETGSLCKACDLLVGAQSQQNPSRTHTFLSLQSTQGLTTIGCSITIWPDLGSVEGVGRPEYIPFLLGFWREGRGAWRKTQLQILRKGLRTRVCRSWLVLISYLQVASATLQHSQQNRKVHGANGTGPSFGGGVIQR